MDGAFVFYVNHSNNKATIHAAICGKFVSRSRDKTLNGYWSTRAIQNPAGFFASFSVNPHSGETKLPICKTLNLIPLLPPQGK